MKINMKTIVIAMVLYGMFAGFAAAETPDAGDTWSTAKSFDLSTGYNFIDGQLTENNPTDNIDCWESNGASVNDYLELYLDSTSYINNVKADLYDGILTTPRLMQHLELNNNVYIDDILLTNPVGVRINGNLEDQEYTFCIYLS